MDIIRKGKKELDGVLMDTVTEAILYAADLWIYPVIKGIPRLTVEAVEDHSDFFTTHLADFAARKQQLMNRYATLIKQTKKKNRRTKQSFSLEWSHFDHQKDRTWDADQEGMLKRFLEETGETLVSLKNKIIFDAGCGNGLLNSLLAEQGIENIAMDLSDSIEKAYELNSFGKAHFIQGDVQYPPLIFDHFDIVHSSGVLIHTNNTELSFSCLVPLVRQRGKLSVWLYHRRNDRIHQLFNWIRKRTSKLPLGIQHFLYRYTLFPVSYIIKRIKGNRQNRGEMMVDILDWFSPQFRWEHDHEEVAAWFYKRQFSDVQVTTDGLFGFNIIGIKN